MRVVALVMRVGAPGADVDDDAAEGLAGEHAIDFGMQAGERDRAGHVGEVSRPQIGGEPLPQVLAHRHRRVRRVIPRRPTPRRMNGITVPR